MYILVYKLSLRLFDAYSLKDKRRVVKSMCHKIHNKFNVSIAEVDQHDMHNLAVIGVSIVSNDMTYNEKTLETVMYLIEETHQVEIFNVEKWSL